MRRDHKSSKRIKREMMKRKKSIKVEAQHAVSCDPAGFAIFFSLDIGARLNGTVLSVDCVDLIPSKQERNRLEKKVLEYFRPKATYGANVG